MQSVFVRFLALLALTFTIGVAAAATDPTVHQIYEAASSGQLEQAQQMMDQVLRDHPGSAKAHYVQSELYAREGKLSLARTELARAEQLAPGLPNENPRSVAELKSQLGLIRPERPSAMAWQSVPRFPWMPLALLVLVVGVLWMLFRRRTTYPVPGTPMPASPNPYGAGYGPGSPPVGAGGVGSTIAGGLAGGLAAGAGIVAGEEIARRLLDGDRRGATPLQDATASDVSNSDMGGDDFGVNDPGSWDDGSSGGGGGGDDWT
jgi:uncharacterized protein